MVADNTHSLIKDKTLAYKFAVVLNEHIKGRGDAKDEGPVPVPASHCAHAHHGPLRACAHHGLAHVRTALRELSPWLLALPRNVFHVCAGPSSRSTMPRPQRPGGRRTRRPKRASSCEGDDDDFAARRPSLLPMRNCRARESPLKDMKYGQPCIAERTGVCNVRHKVFYGAFLRLRPRGMGAAGPLALALG